MCEFLNQLVAPLYRFVCAGEGSTLRPHLQLLLPLNYRAKSKVTQIGVESAADSIWIALATIIAAEVSPLGCLIYDT